MPLRRVAEENHAAKLAAKLIGKELGDIALINAPTPLLMGSIGDAHPRHVAEGKNIPNGLFERNKKIEIKPTSRDLITRLSGANATVNRSDGIGSSLASP